MRGTGLGVIPFSYPLEKVGPTAGAGAFLEIIGQVAVRRTDLVPISQTIPLAVGAATLCLATHGDGTRGREPREWSGRIGPVSLGCDILGQQTWIFKYPCFQK